MQVLVAEDDTQTLATMAHCLSKLGYTVTTVRDGDSALRAIEQNPDIELAVMNWMLPGIDGIAASRKMKARRPGMRTIVVVGGRFCAEVRDAFRPWADHFVSKSACLRMLQMLLGAASPEGAPRKVPVRTDDVMFVDRRHCQLRGIMKNRSGRPLCSLDGRWN